jgi:hypothetical protein
MYPKEEAMAAQSETFPGSDRRQFLEAADALIVSLESARNDATLRHIRGELAQLQRDVERVRGTVDQPRIRPWYVLHAWFWPTVDTAFSALPDGLIA